MFEKTNKLGHRIGARGGRTRQAITEATRRLLTRQRFSEIRVADLAAEAGVSPSNFYTYFKSVEEPVLALSEQVAVEGDRLARHLQSDWSGDRAIEGARALVADMIELWREHGPVLRIEHMLADEGDEAFGECRIRRLRRLHLALERRIAQAQSSGALPEAMSARLASYEIASLVEGVAAGMGLLRRADDDAAIVETTALIVVRLTTGR
ncbi:TetR/AcrR family transcriptional regulator [Brevundimonas sp. S30B]|uniref:TetR/AcrR family transcriptional regulator n=1 Tax=unclassified Brevundimonas TaxID=2622653 RepID=UPI00107295FA|nr:MULTISPECIES: TetR/AcrR family transcriptional regulator [unclassified Brevundimonas]QBX37009.1 TetR/AcrR family transcriptional regulator [Brevundimonas sp. MF30-B]TFW04195.1 TetR/AcrR family transcriptional regulator [Brevundimonas sp. S30B]